MPIDDSDLSIVINKINAAKTPAELKATKEFADMLATEAEKESARKAYVNKNAELKAQFIKQQEADEGIDEFRRELGEVE